MGLISNGTTLLDAGALDSGVATGAMTLIKTITASSSANVSFVHGTSNVVLDGTYKSYIFKYISVHGQTDNKDFQVNFRDGGSSYDATKTSTFFYSYHNEGGTDAALTYYADGDLIQSTGVQMLSGSNGAGNDESLSGEMFLYNPSSTAFVKHFIATNNTYHKSDFSQHRHVAGYCNVTAAIDGVQFSFNSGNIDSGTFKLYGIK
jgi:hypothetical protein